MLKNIAQHSAKNLGARLALTGADWRQPAPYRVRMRVLALAGACWRWAALLRKSDKREVGRSNRPRPTALKATTPHRFARRGVFVVRDRRRRAGTRGGCRLTSPHVIRGSISRQAQARLCLGAQCVILHEVRSPAPRGPVRPAAHTSRITGEQIRPHRGARGAAQALIPRGGRARAAAGSPPRPRPLPGAGFAFPVPPSVPEFPS